VTSALLIIDMQTALCSGDEAAHDIENIIARINALSDAARSANVQVALVQHEEDRGSLVVDSPGWQLAEGLQTSTEDLRIRKRTPNSFHKTELHSLLQERGVTRLVVCGLQTEFCVDTTVRQALALGYDVVLAADAHSTTASDTLSAAQIVAHHNRTLRWMNSFGSKISVVPSHDIRIEA
jgi:nicotinamidase-related amidase